MKKLALFFLLALCQFPLFAQDATTGDNEIKTLFKKSENPAKLGYYIGPEGAWTQFDGRNVFLAGLSMGAIVNHFFTVGLSGYGILNSRNLWYDNIDPYDSTGAYLYGGYGGVKFEFKVLPNAPVPLSFPILIGGGGLVYNTWTYDNHDDNNYDGSTIDWDAFFVVEPGVMVELNLLKFMRFDAGVSYRYTPDLDLVNTKSNLINSFNVNVGLKFGKF